MTSKPIGLTIFQPSAQQTIDVIRTCEQLGIPQVWVPTLPFAPDPLPVLAAANGVFNLLFLLPRGHKDLVSRISVRTFVAFLILSPILGWRYGAFGGAVALIAAEIVMLVWMALALWGREREYLVSGLKSKA